MVDQSANKVVKVSITGSSRMTNISTEYVKSFISIDDYPCEVPSELPKSMKSNSRRKIITSKSGFPYPEVSRRRK